MFIAIAVCLQKRPDDSPVDRPGQAISCPVQGVRVEASGRVEPRGHACRPVVCTRNTLPRIVCLEGWRTSTIIVPAEFQVDLVKRVRIKHGGRDDADSRGGLQDDVDMSVLEIARCPYIGRITALLHGEYSSICASRGKRFIACNDPVLG